MSRPLLHPKPRRWAALSMHRASHHLVRPLLRWLTESRRHHMGVPWSWAIKPRRRRRHPAHEVVPAKALRLREPRARGEPAHLLARRGSKRPAFETLLRSSWGKVSFAHAMIRVSWRRTKARRRTALWHVAVLKESRWRPWRMLCRVQTIHAGEWGTVPMVRWRLTEARRWCYTTLKARCGGRALCLDEVEQKLGVLVQAATRCV